MNDQGQGYEQDDVLEDFFNPDEILTITKIQALMTRLRKGASIVDIRSLDYGVGLLSRLIEAIEKQNININNNEDDE